LGVELGVGRRADPEIRDFLRTWWRKMADGVGFEPTIRF
jgi:hypothetical protein